MPVKKTSTAADELVNYVAKELRKLADARKAKEMAAYMKTTMPFYGVQKPDRVPILREIKKTFKPTDLDTYTESVLALWNQPQREEKYFAINYAGFFKDFINIDSLPLYEQLIREGAWWDFVDAVSSDLVGAAYLKQRKQIKPIMNKWSGDKDLWIRRSALLCQLKHKSETDSEQLFKFCLQMGHEKEFFIQKGMGWALREYAKTDPRAVKRFLKDNRDGLSALTYREGSKHIQ